MRAMSEKQFRSVAEAEARVNIWEGAVRSGKTIGSLLAWLGHVAERRWTGHLLVVGRTRETIARNVFGPLTDPNIFGPLAEHVHYTPGAPSGSILGQRVEVLGASDSRAEGTLRGLTGAGAYVDEATLISQEFWQQLLARMSVPGAKVFVTTNPDGPAHWFKTSVIDRADELGYRTWRFWLEDNAWLVENNPAYIAQLKAEYTGLWYKRFIQGEWVMAEGAVYPMWTDNHIVDHDLLPSMEQVLAIGIDYGTTHATAGILLGLHRGRLYAMDEWHPEQATDVEYSRSLRAWMAERPTPRTVFVDPAAKSFRLQLFDDGVTAASAHNNVLPGIRTVASLLATNRLLVSDRCTHLIRELPSYVWDKKATDRGEDKPVKENDDFSDALRYAVYSSRQRWRTYVPSATAEDNVPGAAAEREW